MLSKMSERSVDMSDHLYDYLINAYLINSYITSLSITMTDVCGQCRGQSTNNRYMSR